jgi:DNA-binding NtrC family response regulator
VRVLATTNRNIEESVERGEFRQDLFYRLNVIPLRLPPLAQRGEDVLLLADFFICRNAREYGLGVLQLSDDARQWLMAHDWPGNVRELQNLMERAVLLAGGGPIRPVHFLMDGQDWSPEDEGPEERPASAAPVQPSSVSFEEGGRIPTIQEMEMQLIIKSLDRTSGNRTKASELLGISVRTLRNKLGEYRKIGLDIP